MAINRGFVTHCGFVQFFIIVPYEMPCCDQNPLTTGGEDGPLIDYICIETNPLGQCGDDNTGGNISNNAAQNPAYPRVSPGLRSFAAVQVTDNGLSFTTSAYGGMLPIVYGSDKLPGNVIWASPIQNHFLQHEEEIVLYKTLNFALGICEGTIAGVLRMWVDGKLILDNTALTDGNGVITPNADGFVLGFSADLTDPDSPLQSLDPTKRQTKITVFNGSETQVPEGIIVAVEGPENTPAYRGLAYVLFENWVTADSRIPAIEVEVSANVTNLWPRLYTDLVGATFNTVTRLVLHTDHYFDRLFIVASHSVGGEFGLVTFDGNSMTELAQQDFSVSVGNWDNFAQTLSGLVVVTSNSGNNGIVHVLNPFTGTVAATLGPGGSISGHSLSTGFGAMQKSSMVMSGFDANGLIVDVYAGISLISKSIGLATISKTGAITMRSVLNDTLPARNTTCAPLIIEDEHAALAPTFGDAFPSAGMHIFGMAYEDNEITAIRPWRVTLFNQAEGATLDAPIYGAYSLIPLTEFGGTGFAHSVHIMMVDTDGCFVFFVEPIADAGRSTFLCKWSPFLDALVWKVPVSGLPTAIQSADGGVWATLIGQTYAWIDAAGKVLQIDLQTGVIKILLNHLSDQNLPTNLDRRQFYNGFENSILYFSATNGQEVVKIYLDRITRSTALVSDIVEDLTGRAGFKPADLEVVDLSVLTVQGYTIKEVKDIRSCFGELQQAFTFDVFESDGKIKYTTRGSLPTTYINHQYIGLGENGAWLPAVETNDGARNRKLNLTYRDIGRDYDDNVQSIILDKTGPHIIDSQAGIDVRVPVVLEANDAKRLAEILLYAKNVNKTSFEFPLPPRFSALDPGDVIGVVMPDATLTLLRIRKTAVGADKSILITASLEDPDIYNDQLELFGNVGRYTSDTFPATTPRIDVFYMPIGGLSDEDFAATTSTYRIFLAFLNYRPINQNDLKPFKLVILSPGETTTDLLLNAPIGFPTWGFVVDPPDYVTGPYSTDETSVLRVKLLNKTGAAMGPAPLGLDSLIASSQCNLCLVGQELIQFRDAVDEGNDTWRLTGLHRAKFGTDVAPTPVAGDKFILFAGPDAVIDGQGTTIVDVPLAGGPRKAFQAFLDTNNPFQPTEAIIERARNLQPWSVADIIMSRDGSDWVIAWQRRTRFGGEWPDDGSDAVPLNETEERYIVWLTNDIENFSPVNSDLYLRRVEVTSPTFTYTAAMQAEDGFVDATDILYAMIVQVGSTGQDNGPGLIHQA